MKLRDGNLPAIVVAWGKHRRLFVGVSVDGASICTNPDPRRCIQASYRGVFTGIG